MVVLTSGGRVIGFDGDHELYSIDISDIVMATRVTKILYVSASNTSLPKPFIGI